jgi:hypothetical protein
MAKQAKRGGRGISAVRPDTAAYQAIGSHEASSLMGVHYTVPYRMAARGRLSSQNFETPEGRQVTFFDGGECEENWVQYCRDMAAGGTGKRPRDHTEHRDTVLAHLAAVKTRITLADAISTSEAVKILGTQASYAVTLARTGKIVGRQLWSARSRRGLNQWMFSRRSCLANVASVKAAFAAGKTVGRIRDSIRLKKSSLDQ